MSFKKMACWRLANKYGLAVWDVFLPTGCDCILESIFEKEEFYDEHGLRIDLVNKDISYILKMAVPLLGVIAFLFRIVWRYKVLYRYTSKALHPNLSDWERLFFVAIPPVYYLKVWGDNKC